MNQLVFTIQSSSSYHEDDFVVADSNYYAYEYLISKRNIWGVAPYENLLILTGPPFSGKTHLSYIWQKKNHALFVRPTENIYDFHQCNIICENIDRIEDETQFFHFINERISSSSKTLLTCNNGKLQFQLPDLSSRINSIHKVRIDEPNESLMTSLFNKLFADLNLKVNTKVINYLLYRTPRTYKDINMIVAKINEVSMSDKKEITIPFITHLLGQHIKENV